MHPKDLESRLTTLRSIFNLEFFTLKGLINGLLKTCGAFVSEHYQNTQDIEAEFPPRALPEGAKVTRFAPSPTGFVHFGGLFPSTVAERLAHQSGGVLFLRIEDTDARREVAGAAEGLIKTLATYVVNFDEGAILDENGNLTDCGAYGPYKQSKRVDIYHVFAKKLVEEGKAYPVFTTKEELEALNSIDKKA